MIEQSRYIVQYVGFKTNLNDIDFIERWMPFAQNFKRAGIVSIDLYQVTGSDSITFISRNIWDARNYFKNFPTGVAGSGSGGGILVKQFGGFWITENELDSPGNIQLLFSNENFPPNRFVRKRCSETVSFENQIEFSDVDNEIAKKFKSELLVCKHVKTIQ